MPEILAAFQTGISTMMIEILGWIATVVFVCSFFFKERTLKIIQAFGAVLWIIYGVAIKANPVVIANSIVIVAIVLSLLKNKDST